MQPRTTLGGWGIVAVCFLVLSVSFAARAVPGLSMPYLEPDFGWTRSFLVAALALALLAGLLSFAIGEDREPPTPALGAAH